MKGDASTCPTSSSSYSICFAENQVFWLLFPSEIQGPASLSLVKELFKVILHERRKRCVFVISDFLGLFFSTL